MNVKDRMTKNPFTVKKNESVSDARQIMKREKIHRLPVIDSQGHMLGIITEKDILHASPSPASSLDVWEMTSLLANLNVADVMTENLITCQPDTPIEEAARLLSDNDIGGLPVIEDSLLTGIITESDIFEIFLELFSIRTKGLRMTFLAPDVPGELANLAAAISKAGGDIQALGFVRGENATNRWGIAKIVGIKESKLKSAVKPYVQEIREIREI